MSGKDETGESYVASVDTYTGRISYTVFNQIQIPVLDRGQQKEMKDILLEFLDSYWYNL